jgi:hypothetical protein
MLAEVRELDDGREHERFQNYLDKANTLLPFLTQFSKWARDASEESIQALLGELEDDTNRWDKEWESEAIREYINSMELPEEKKIAYATASGKPLVKMEGVGRSAIWWIRHAIVFQTPPDRLQNCWMSTTFRPSKPCAMVRTSTPLRIVSLCVICLNERIARAAADGHVSNVRGPYLVRPVDPQAAEQIRKYPVPGRRLARPRRFR